MKFYGKIGSTVIYLSALAHQTDSVTHFPLAVSLKVYLTP